MKDTLPSGITVPYGRGTLGFAESLHLTPWTRLAYPQLKVIPVQRFIFSNTIPQPKLAIPLAVIVFLVSASHRKTERGKAIADLAVIAFYYLLRVGEYTWHKKSDRRHTQQCSHSL